MELLGWFVAVVAAAAAAWFALAARRARTAEAQARERLAAETAAQRELAAADERARIAREMHDVVAHTLSVVVAQADGGRFVAQSDPDAAERTLATIGEVSRTALAEMRSLLGVLRASDGTAAMAPQPSLEDIPRLVAEAREQGMDVSLVTTGTPHPLPIGAGLAAHRIVQEGLTNVRRHGGPGVRAFVQLAWQPNGLSVQVADDGRGAAVVDDGTGHGIIGMRERVAQFGGTLTAGPRAGGGFVVHAHLPISAQGGDA